VRSGITACNSRVGFIVGVSCIRVYVRGFRTNAHFTMSLADLRANSSGVMPTGSVPTAARARAYLALSRPHHSSWRRAKINVRRGAGASNPYHEPNSNPGTPDSETVGIRAQQASGGPCDARGGADDGRDCGIVAAWIEAEPDFAGAALRPPAALPFYGSARACAVIIARLRSEMGGARNANDEYVSCPARVRSR